MISKNKLLTSIMAIVLLLPSITMAKTTPVEDWTNYFSDMQHNCDFSIDMAEDKTLLVPNQKKITKKVIKGDFGDYIGTIYVDKAKVFGSSLNSVTYGVDKERSVMILRFNDNAFMNMLPKFTYESMDGVRLKASAKQKSIKKGIYTYVQTSSGYNYRGAENGQAWYGSMAFDPNKKTIACIWGHH